MFRQQENEKPPAFSNSSGLKSVFKKLRFRDGLVWTVDTTLEIKLLFQIPSVYCGSGVTIRFQRGIFLQSYRCAQIWPREYFRLPAKLMRMKDKGVTAVASRCYYFIIASALSCRCEKINPQNPYLTPEGFKLFHKSFSVALPFLHLSIQTFQAVLKSFAN